MKLTQVDPALLEVTPSDFLHVATSGVDFSGALEGLSKYLNKRENVESYLQQTP